MKEIGGYFGLEELQGKPLYSQAIGLNCARSALLYLVKARKIRKLWLPYFLCGCVSDMCRRYNIPVEFYHIGDDLLPKEVPQPAENEALYLVNYYGQRTSEEIYAIQKKTGNLILDNVQAYFAAPLPGVDTLNSCRKFFGVPDGAWLFTEENTEITPENCASANGHFQHLIGRYEETGSAYYGEFQKADGAFEQADFLRMSPVTENLLRAVDYDAVRAARESNFNALHQTLKKRNGLPVRTPEGPYCYPFLLPENADGRAIRRALAEEKIYVPTLWPDIPENSSSWEKRLAFQLLPLPCDQRYGAEEMNFMLSKLEELL